jgi:spermidine synthase
MTYRPANQDLARPVVPSQSPYTRLFARFAQRPGLHVLIEIGSCRGELLSSRPHVDATLRDVARTLGLEVRPVTVRGNDVRLTARLEGFGWSIAMAASPRLTTAFVAVSFTASRDKAPRTLQAERVLELCVHGFGAKRGHCIMAARGRGDVVRTRHVSSFDLGTTIFAYQAPNQCIELTLGTRGLALLLDGRPQFIEGVEHEYHEPLVHLPMACAPRLGKVGIGGGGDGLALREVLRWAAHDLGAVMLYDIDPFVLCVSSGHPRMVELNAGSLTHAKAEVRAADVRAMLSAGADFDVVILDFPSFSDGDYGHLFSPGLFRQVAAALAPDGVLMVQNTDYPDAEQRTAANVARSFAHVLQIDYPGYQHIRLLMASNEPIRAQRDVPSGTQLVDAAMAAHLLERSHAVRGSAGGDLSGRGSRKFPFALG